MKTAVIIVFRLTRFTLGWDLFARKPWTREFWRLPSWSVNPQPTISPLKCSIIEQWSGPTLKAPEQNNRAFDYSKRWQGQTENLSTNTSLNLADPFEFRMRREQNRKIAETVARPRIVCVLTSSLGIGFLRGQLASLREAGYDVTVVSSPGNELTHAGQLEGVQIVPIQIAREVSPLRDLISLCQLWRLMRRLRPTITNVGTPKAGLLGGLAAFLAAVPCRFYTLRGLRLETASGMQRLILLFAERLACKCAHRVICVSESLRQKAVALGLVNRQRTRVLGSGSSNGVEISQFEIDPRKKRKVLELRSNLGIPPTASVVGFVGRFTRDKGIAELLQAFSLLRERQPELRLLLVGNVEEGDPPAADVLQRMKTDRNIVCPGFVADPALYYSLMDVLVLPTHREGFPNVVLEANASGKPACGTHPTDPVAI